MVTIVQARRLISLPTYVYEIIVLVSHRLESDSYGETLYNFNQISVSTNSILQFETRSPIPHHYPGRQEYKVSRFVSYLVSF